MNILKAADIWGLLALGVFLSGCESGHRGGSTESELPWNRPATWELKREITTSDSLHKEYTSDELTRHHR